MRLNPFDRFQLTYYALVMSNIFLAVLLALPLSRASEVDCEQRLAPSPSLPNQARKYPVALPMGLTELAELMTDLHIKAPPQDLRPGVHMSDRELARYRNLKRLFPALINRKLKFQVSYDDHSNGHFQGSIRRIDLDQGWTTVTFTVEGFRRALRPLELTIRADWITAVSAMNSSLPTQATDQQIDSVRRYRTSPRELLGQQLLCDHVSGVLIASNIEFNQFKLHVLELADGHFESILVNSSSPFTAEELQ